MKKLLLLAVLMVSGSVFAIPHGNPASIYCINHGGESIIIDSQGYWHLPSRKICDEYTFQKGQCPSSQTKQIDNILC